MIKVITEAHLPIIAQYVYDLNVEKEHQCRPFNNEYTYEVIYEKYLELFVNENDQVLIAVDKHDAIYGVLGVFTELNEKYVQAMGGVYTHLEYKTVFSEFHDYLTNEYCDHKMLFAFPLENIRGIEAMITNGYNQIENAIIFENELIDLYKEDCPYIVGYNEVNESDILSFYNEYQGDVYWTLPKILEKQSDWLIKNYVVDGEILGSIYIYLYDYYNAEVFGIINKGSFNRDYIDPLLKYGINECLRMGLENIIVFADAKTIISSCISLSLKETDTHLTFEKIL